MREVERGVGRQRGLQLMDCGCHKKLAALHWTLFLPFLPDNEEELKSIFHFELNFFVSTNCLEKC